MDNIVNHERKVSAKGGSNILEPFKETYLTNEIEIPMNEYSEYTTLIKNKSIQAKDIINHFEIYSKYYIYNSYQNLNKFVYEVSNFKDFCSLDNHKESIDNIVTFYETTYNELNNAKIDDPKVTKRDLLEELNRRSETIESLQQIINTKIEKLFEIYMTFLEEANTFFDETNNNPVNKFINKHKNILNEIGLNFEGAYDELLKDYTPLFRRKNVVKISNESKLTSDNINTLLKGNNEISKIILNNISNNYNEFFTEYNNMNTVTNLTLRNSSFKDIKFSEFTPQAKTLVITNCINIYNTNPLLEGFTVLKKLTLSNINLTNISFMNVIDLIAKQKELLYHLKYLSFASNKITKVDLTKLNEVSQENHDFCFENLTEISFENNKIYFFSEFNLNFFRKIRVINLSSNNISFEENYNNLLIAIDNHEKMELNRKQDDESIKPEDKHIEKILLIIAKNLFMLKKDIRDQYIKILNDILPTFNYGLRDLTFEGLFYVQNKNLFPQIQINKELQSSLHKLNLSMCYLNDDDVINFISNNTLLRNLKTLQLCDNNLSDNFIKMYNDQHLHNTLISLERIDISGNDKFSCKDTSSKNEIVKFLNDHNYLRKIICKKTQFDIKFINEYTKGVLGKISNEVIEKEFNEFITIYEENKGRNVKFYIWGNMFTKDELAEINQINKLKMFVFVTRKERAVVHK